MSISKQLNDSTRKGSPKDLTAFDFYADKFKNFKEHVRKIATYNTSIKTWSNHLDKMNLAVFISLIEPKTEQYEDMSELFDCEMKQNNVNPDEIHEDDMIKLHRYAELFTIMLKED